MKGIDFLVKHAAAARPEVPAPTIITADSCIVLALLSMLEISATWSKNFHILL